jgi:hypothetical protein
MQPILTSAHIAGRMDSRLDRGVGANSLHICYKNLGVYPGVHASCDVGPDPTFKL